jgi:hypothetical protein
MGTEKPFKPVRLRVRATRYVTAAAAATIGYWFLDHISGVHDSVWSLVRFMAIMLVVAAPISDWFYRRQARAAERRKD